MNPTPEEKKPSAPPQGQQQPKWNPYYRRNPDGTPGDRSRTLQQNAAARERAADRAQYRQNPAESKPQEPTAAPARPQDAPREGQQGLGAPVRRASPAARVRPAGQSEPMAGQHPGGKAGNAPKPGAEHPTAPGGVRYRRQSDGTMTRVYPRRHDTRAGARRRRMLVVALAALVVLIALIIGIVALVRGAGSKIEYTYDYNGQFTVKIKGDEAIDDDTPYLNMNYLAAIYSMTVSGSYDDMMFSTAAGEYVSFVPNSRVAMVNGNRHIMDDMARLRGQEMWVPSDFVEEMFDGIKVVWDHDKYTVTVTPAPVSETDSTAAPLTFALRPESALSQPAEDTWADGYDYLTDMTEFRDAIEPANRDAYLILVNQKNSLSATYVPTDLVRVTNMREGRDQQRMNEVAELALQGLYQDLYAAGYTDVGVTSGYRTYKMQELLHDRYVYEEMEAHNISYEAADKLVCRYSAYAGQSEHQTGLAVDMYNTAAATVEFAETEAFKWLKDHAHQYGFILRYPEDKTDITGFDFEPWHFRYVGRYHATQMYEQNLCLEEYLAKLDLGN